MKRIYTLCNSEEEANALGHFIISKGYEGVQNDSYRYCDLEISLALKENRRHHRNFCFIGVNGCQMVVGKSKKEMIKKIIPKHCTLPVYHCADGIDTVVCFSFLNERFEECTNTNCECYKK